MIYTPDSLREYANDQTEYGNIGCGTQSKLFVFADAWEADRKRLRQFEQAALNLQEAFQRAALAGEEKP
jgi:hypothetical protein